LILRPLNFLLYGAPPQPEVGTPPCTVSKVFGWDAADGETGHVAPFLAAGDRLNRSLVMATGRSNAPRRVSPEVRVRRLETDDDLARML
jgi:hypothetical protein